ncbi:MAG: DNA-3-methyladenine glycosylase [Hyphomicrobiales bacterium]|nr:MAG: DNA-3-methyladenine glycosylase [Hyphomicrobiales bacterium]
MHPLPLAFFDRPADRVARDLIGATLFRADGDCTTPFLIEETEAYLGPHDLACHTARGRTRRTEVMFGPPGRFYVYKVYGLHLLLNVVTGPAGIGSAVLLRSAGGFRGPGRLGRALGLTLALNGQPAVPETGLWFASDGEQRARVKRTARIGVDYAGARWAARKLRFVRTGKARW